MTLTKSSICFSFTIYFTLYFLLYILIDRQFDQELITTTNLTCHLREYKSCKCDHVTYSEFYDYNKYDRMNLIDCTNFFFKIYDKITIITIELIIFLFLYFTIGLIGINYYLINIWITFTKYYC